MTDAASERAPEAAPSSSVAVSPRWATPGSLWLWAVRIAWVVIGAMGWTLVEQISSQRDEWSLLPVAITTGVLWLVGVIGLAALSTVGLTATRIIIPLSALFAVVAIIIEPGPESLVMAAAAAVATTGALSGDYGQRFVQSSAYGDEHRFGLRPPAGYLVAATIAWLVWAGLGAAAVSTATAARWWIATALAAVWVAATAVALPRWHLLSTRWLVLVPAGLVVHDRLMLAETIMLKRSELAGLSLAETSSSAVDITGPSSGHAIEIRTVTEFVIVRAPARRRDATPEHTAAVLVAPARPGRALEASRTQRISVGAPE